ncbi:MAG TPA: cytochrome P450 [Pirellulales bacterium]|nr:cytochrome P450 [Pirellulales bacterium]
MSSVVAAELAEISVRSLARPRAAALPLRGLQAARWYAKFFVDPVRCMTEAYERFGPVVPAGRITRLQGRERQHVLALGPDCNRQVLGNTEVFHTTAQAWPGPRGSAMRRVRNGLTRMNGERYRQQRQLMLPTFSKKAVAGYIVDMTAVVRGHLEEEWHNGATIDIYQQSRRLALRMSSQVLFGRQNPEDAYSLAALVQQFIPRNFSPGVWICPFNLPFTPFRRMIRNAGRIENALQRLIDERRANPSQHTDVLKILVQAFDEQHVPIDESELIGQATVMFIASYENVASVLTWTLFLLAQHPDVMSDLHAELAGTLGDGPPDPEQIEKLPLLDAVIKESMRVLPPVPYLLRKPSVPTSLGGFELRKNDRVAVSAYITHHLSDLYPQPRRFIPDRWFSIKPTPYEYLPFGAGPRACLGKLFAVAEIKIALAMILLRHRLSVVPDITINRRVQVMMSPKRGLPMAVHHQDRCFGSAPVRGNIHEMVELN